MKYIAIIKNERNGLSKEIDLVNKDDNYTNKLKWFYKKHRFMSIEIKEII